MVSKWYNGTAWRHAILLALALLSLAPPALVAQGSLPPPPPVLDPRFGIVGAYEAPEMATAAGAGWTRVLFYWHEVQPNGPEDWNPFFLPDRVVEREVRAGRELVGIILGTAPWASESTLRNAVPEGLYLPYDDPGNLWGQFMSLMASRYAGQIDHWVIWNEPDVWDDSYEGKSWAGGVEEYAQLLKVAYLAANAVNPEAVIHLAATTYWWDAQYGREPYFERLLSTLRADPEAAAHDGFFDVATVHVYFKPQQVYDLTRYFREQLDRHDFHSKPLWINETNAPPSSDPHHPAPDLRFPVSLEAQSNFLVQAWALGLAAGAERIAYYKARDEPWLPPGVEPYGLLRNDDSLRPVFWTYRTLVTYLGGYRDARAEQIGELWQVEVDRGDLGTTTVVWNSGTVTESLRLPARAEEALLVGVSGPLTHLEPQDGFYTLLLPPGEGNEIGGAPFLLVEGAGTSILLEGPGEPRTSGALPTVTQEAALSPTIPPPTATATTPPVVPAVEVRVSPTAIDGEAPPAGIPQGRERREPPFLALGVAAVALLAGIALIFRRYPA